MLEDFYFIAKQKKVKPTIIKQVKKDKNIVYGARAMNAQMSFGFLGRQTNDFDIYSSKAKKSANKLEDTLDKKFGGDFFYVQPAKHAGTWKVKAHSGKREVADFTKMPIPKPAVVKKKGIMFERISSIKKGKKKTLMDPESKYRHFKDRQDLGAIQASSALSKSLLLFGGNKNGKRKKGWLNL